MLRNRASLVIPMFGLLLPACLLAAAPAPKPDFVNQVNLEQFRLIAVQHDGRFKTFDTLARSSLRHLSGSETFQWDEAGKAAGPRQDAAFTYLDILFRPEAYRDARIIRIKEKVVLDRLVLPVKDQLDAATRQAIFDDKRVSLSFLMRPEVRAALDELNRDIMRTAKKVEAILDSAAYTDARVLQRLMRVIPVPGSASDQDRWYSIEDLSAAALPDDHTHAGMSAPRSLPGVGPALQRELAGKWSALREAWTSQNAAAVNTAANALADEVAKVNPGIYPALSKLTLERRYYKYNKMLWTWAVYLLAMVLLLMSIVYRWPRAMKVGVVFFLIAFTLHTIASGIRWYLAGRIPNSNMFEAVTAAAWFGCAVALFFELAPALSRWQRAWHAAIVMVAGGFTVWLGTLLINGIPVDAWKEWPSVAIAALIIFAIGCMAMISLTAARQMVNYKGVPLFAASAVAMVALMCGQFMKNALDSDIGRTMPVLNDLWLYVHTNMIIASYALIGLAFCTAALYLVGRMLTTPWAKAWPMWLGIGSGALFWPLLALPSIVNQVAAMFRPGPAPILGWPFTLETILSAWLPFVIVIVLFLIAAVVFLLWRKSANRAYAAWEGLPLGAAGVVSGGRGAAWSAALNPGGGSPNKGGQGESLAKVFDGATMLLLELSFIMLWTGIIMGAVWADHSWGRPWGWDPKEVFALNTWIIFLILVHVRLKVVDKQLWTAILAVWGTSIMMFNWVVVNFFIVGLHSYA